MLGWDGTGVNFWSHSFLPIIKAVFCLEAITKLIALRTLRITKIPDFDLRRGHSVRSGCALLSQLAVCSAADDVTTGKPKKRLLNHCLTSSLKPLFISGPLHSGLFHLFLLSPLFSSPILSSPLFSSHLTHVAVAHPLLSALP